jgi:hypothetical protein
VKAQNKSLALALVWMAIWAPGEFESSLFEAAFGYGGWNKKVLEVLHRT